MTKFMVCKKCGNMVGMLQDAGVPMMCCGEKMEELLPNTEDASVEKHVPEVTVDGNKISVVVGSVIHPMTEAHYIGWIYLETKNGGQRQALPVTGEPKAEFLVADGDAPVAVYAYCNLHGLWKKEI